MIRLICPCCGFAADFDGFTAAGDQSRALALALELPREIARPLMQYLRLFSPENRRLRLDKLCALLRELKDICDDAKIERRGRIWPVPLTHLQAALEQMIEARDAGKLVLPLKSHGYLMEILAGMASQAESRGEKASESRRSGRIDAPAHPSHIETKPEKPETKRPIPETAATELSRYTRGSAA